MSSELSWRSCSCHWRQPLRYIPQPFAQSLGYRPAIQYFVAEQEWTQYTFRFEQFGIDGHDLTGVFVGGGPEEGDFVLQIDDVRLE
jgi:hypothetical protein